MRDYAARPLEPEVEHRILDAGRAGRQREEPPAVDVPRRPRRRRGRGASPSPSSSRATSAAPRSWSRSYERRRRHRRRPRRAEHAARPPTRSGVGSCPNGISDRVGLNRALRLDDDAKIAAVLSFGYPAKPRDPRAPQRRGVDRARPPQAVRRGRPRDLASRQDGQQRAELDLGLGQLGRRVGVAHDADARVEPRLAPAQQRAAQRDAELAVLVGVGPADRAGVPAAVDALERRDLRRGDGVRLAADGGRRVQQPGELDRAARVRELGADRRREVLDVGDLDDRRLVRRGDPDASAGAARGRSGARRSRCSSRSLSERSSCSPRWSSTAGSAERRVEPASATVEARRPSRRTSSSGEAATNAASPRAGAEHVAGARTPPAARRTPRRRRAAPARGRPPRARARSSRTSPARMRSTARATARLVVLGRRDRGDVEAPGRARGRAAAAAPARSSAARASSARRQLARARRRAWRARPA